MTTYLEESKLFILSTLMLIALCVLSVQLQRARDQDFARNPADTAVTTIDSVGTSATPVADVQATTPLPPKPSIRGVYNEDDD